MASEPNSMPEGGGASQTTRLHSSMEQCKLWSSSANEIGVLEHLLCYSKIKQYETRHGVGGKLPTIAIDM
jgi:hypothetical protein